MLTIDRAGALALVNGSAQCFSLMISEIFSDAPHYYRGKGFSLAATVLAALLTPIFMLYLKRGNERKDRDSNTPKAKEDRLKSLEELCDAHPDFRYWL
jgi:hypothetical protein